MFKPPLWFLYPDNVLIDSLSLPPCRTVSSFVKNVFKRWELGDPNNIPSIKALSSGDKTRLSSRPALPDSFLLGPGWSLKL